MVINLEGMASRGGGDILLGQIDMAFNLPSDLSICDLESELSKFVAILIRELTILPSLLSACLMYRLASFCCSADSIFGKR
jgi:hypothetical protein